ncbi:hypothetical protein ACFL20_09930 [Spirochaetota bacterium]
MKKIIIFIFIFSVSVFMTGNDFGKIASASGDVVVIVNKSRGSLTSSNIKRIFSGKMTRWPGGGRIKVLLNRNSAIYNSFSRKYLRKSPTSVDNLWVKENIRTGVAIPRKVPSSVIKMMVSNSSAFIGFVKRSEAGTGVKIIE